MKKLGVQYTVEINLELTDDQYDDLMADNISIDELIEDQYPAYPTGSNYNFSLYKN